MKEKPKLDQLLPILFVRDLAFEIDFYKRFSFGKVIEICKEMG